MKNEQQITFKKSYFLWMFCFVAFGFLSSAQAQSQTISGTITDENNSPLPSASVTIKGSTTGTTADFDGKYTISNVSADAVLIFSYIGYVTKEVSVNGQTTINVNLEPDAQALDEVVVVGYGSEKRSQITGSVASVSTEALTRVNSASIDNALQGLTAGVSVTNNNASPGGGVSVRIRGAGGVNGSEPLYVVDGFPISVGGSERSSPLSSINPQDIKSITVLKDAASAAIYGTRAANGVVLITTKRGRNQKGTASLNVRTGFQRIANTLDLMDAETFVRTTNLAYQNAGRAIPPGFDNPESFGAGTDWIDTITRAALTSDIQASFAGGSESSNFFLSLGRFKQEGIVKGSDFERITMRLNADNKISEKLKVGASVAFTRSKQQGLGNVRGTNTALSFATLFYPTIPVFDANGDYAPTPANGFYKPVTNPLFRAEGPTTPPVTLNLQGNIYAQYKIVPNLEFKTSGFYTINNTVAENYGRIFDLGAAGSTEVSLAKSQATSTVFLIENTLNYNASINNDHVIGLLVGQSLQRNRFQSIRLNGQNDNEGEPLVIDELTTSLDVNDFVLPSTLLSYFGKANYSFKNKYLMTAIVRRDASSKFGSNNRWGTFPSFSVGWNIYNENFISKDGALSSLKLRAGWGQVGQDNIGDFEFLSSIARGFNYPFGNVPGGVTSGSATDGIENPDLKWETVTQSSVGVDANFFDDKLSIIAEYYNKEQEDVLVDVPQSGVSGISNGRNQSGQRQNIGRLINKGIEFTANYAGVIGKLNFNIGANITTIDNEVLDNPAPINRRNLTRTENGRSLGEFYGFLADGLFQTQAEVDAGATQNANTAPGDIRYVDISGPNGVPDGVIDADHDRTFIGNPIPDFTYGFNLNLEYDNFDFSMQAAGMSGNDVYNTTKVLLTDYNRSENKLNITPWSPSNPNTTFPRAIAEDVGNSLNSSYHVEDGSFTRIKVIELGYSVPTKVLEKLKISNIRLYGNVQNPFTFTKYSGTDPEVGSANGSNLEAGIDNFIYPIARTFSIGLNAKF